MDCYDEKRWPYRDEYLLLRNECNPYRDMILLSEILTRFGIDWESFLRKAIHHTD